MKKEQYLEITANDRLCSSEYVPNFLLFLYSFASIATKAICNYQWMRRKRTKLCSTDYCKENRKEWTCHRGYLPLAQTRPYIPSGSQTQDYSYNIKSMDHNILFGNVVLMAL